MLQRVFRIDSPFYRFMNLVYYLLVTNFLWILFSLPIFTAGASTTALYYIMGKVVRGEGINIFRDFWGSFKLNFKQATIIWVIMIALYAIVYVNIMNIGTMGELGKYLAPIQYAILFELILVSIYIFPILSRYEITLGNLIKAAFFMGNRYILTTLMCMASIGVIFYTASLFTELFILVFVSFIALVLYFFINKSMKRYMSVVQVENQHNENVEN